MPCMRSLSSAAAAPPDWMQIVPPRLDLLRRLREVNADVVVLGADIGGAQALSFSSRSLSQVRTGMLACLAVSRA